jgi:predicted transcriptional regulator
MRQPDFPEPIGVFRSIDRPIYEEGVLGQVEEAIQLRGAGDLQELYSAADTWEVSSEFDEEYMGVLFYGQESSAPEVGHSLLTDTLADLKPKQPLTAHVDISLAEAAGKLKDVNVGFLALVDDEGKLVGVFTEGDIFTKIACKIEDMSREKVKDYMTSSVTTLRADDPITHALHLMSIHQFRHIPLVDEEGKPEGVISFRSVVHYIEENFALGGKNGRNGKN